MTAAAEPQFPVPWPADLRITGIRVITTAPEGHPFVIVKVLTDRPGLYGVGCASQPQRPLAVAAVVEHHLAPLLLGRDPRDIEDLWQAMHVSGYWRDGGIENHAVAGVDTALWDLAAKAAGLPLWRLLGGRVRSAVQCYTHAEGRTPEEACDDAERLVSDGYRHVRIQVQVPGTTTYGIHHEVPAAAGGPLRPPVNRWDPRAYLTAVPALFDLARQRLGPDVELLHDVHERLAPAYAATLAAELDRHRLFFLEDLLAPEDADSLRHVRSSSTVPLALGEVIASTHGFLPLVTQRLIDIARIRLGAVGGLTPARRLAAVCAAHGVTVAPHGPPDVSPVGHAVALAWDVSLPNLAIQEHSEPGPLTRRVFPGTVVAREGLLQPTEAPGHGVDVDEELASRYPLPPAAASLGWTQVRLPDGTITRP